MIKNYRKFLIVFSILLILFITAGSISACENITEGGSLENLKADDGMAVDDGFLDNGSDEGISNETSDSDMSTNSSDVQQNTSNASSPDDNGTIDDGNGGKDSHSNDVKVYTNVVAPKKTVDYKKSTYYIIKILDSKKRPVKGISLKVKVFTGNKSKIYRVKTNSRGLAKLQTKNLALGKHKISISTYDSRYVVSKTSKIIVKTAIVPKLKSLNYYHNAKGYKAKLTWHSKSGRIYDVLKKTKGKYRVIATVKAKGNTASYTEKVKKGELATYSVRQSNKGKTVGSYDREGLSLIKSTKVKVDFQNMKAVVKWNRVKDASKYKIFRKVGYSGKFKCIATVDAKQNKYVDWYYKATKLGKLLRKNVFLDPTTNDLFYTVRACGVKDVRGVEKTSNGLALDDGDFNLEAPVIISLKKNKITWGKVVNAKGYQVFKKSKSSSSWKKIGETAQNSAAKLSFNVGNIDKKAYYTVRAYATKNGVKVYSGFDKGFTLKNYADSNSKYNILYMGDSISRGFPYSDTKMKDFSMPHRVAQLTGCEYYNPSIYGASYRDLSSMSAKTIAKYNVVVLSVGTNDYMFKTKLGSVNGNSDKSTFNGAVNYVLKTIKKASDSRVKKGLTPIKVVFVDLFYSDRASVSVERLDRDVTPNKNGLTLMDYQSAINAQMQKWKKAGLKVYNFKTRSYNLVTKANCPYSTADNLHLTKFTYAQYGNAIAQFLVRNVFK